MSLYDTQPIPECIPRDSWLYRDIQKVQKLRKKLSKTKNRNKNAKKYWLLDQVEKVLAPDCWMGEAEALQRMRRITRNRRDT